MDLELTQAVPLDGEPTDPPEIVDDEADRELTEEELHEWRISRPDYHGIPMFGLS
jgi:hypothetical protein